MVWIYSEPEWSGQTCPDGSNFQPPVVVGVIIVSWHPLATYWRTSAHYTFPALLLDNHSHVVFHYDRPDICKSEVYHYIPLAARESRSQGYSAFKGTDCILDYPHQIRGNFSWKENQYVCLVWIRTKGSNQNRMQLEAGSCTHVIRIGSSVQRE